MARSRSDSFEFPTNRFLLKERKHIHVILINGNKMVLSYDKSTHLSDIFDAACQHVKINEREMFGLAVAMDDLFLFLDMNSKVSKINFKSIRKKSCSAANYPHSIVSPASPSVPTVHFRVQFYVRSHTLRERYTKHLYYQQLLINLLTYKLFCPIEVYFQLAALALQAEFGPFDLDKDWDSGDYFEPKSYFPHWIVTLYGDSYIRGNLPALHRQHENLSRMEAEFRFIRLASTPPSSFNMHLFPLVEKSAFDRKADLPIWVGLSPVGIELHKERVEDELLSQMSTLVWSQIVHLTYKKRKFIVEVKGGRTMLLEASNNTQAEHLFWLCQRMHRYQTTAQLSALHTQEALEGNDRRTFRESYVYSDNDDMEMRRRCDSNVSSLLRQVHLRDVSGLASTSYSSGDDGGGCSYGYNSLPNAKRASGRARQLVDQKKVKVSSHQLAEEAAAAMVAREKKQGREEVPERQLQTRQVESSRERHSEAGAPVVKTFICSPVDPPAQFKDSSQLDISYTGIAELPPPPQFRSEPLSSGYNHIKPPHSDTLPFNNNTINLHETNIDDLSPLATTDSLSNGSYSPGRAIRLKDDHPILVRHQDPGPMTSSPLSKKSVSLDQVDQASTFQPNHQHQQLLLDRELSRSFPLLANLCHEFNRPELLLEGRNVPPTVLPSSATAPSVCMRSWQSQTLHLDQVGHSGSDSLPDSDGEVDLSSPVATTPGGSRQNPYLQHKYPHPMDPAADSLHTRLSDMQQYSHDRAGHSYVNMGSNPMLCARTSCA